MTRADVVALENLPGMRRIDGKPALSAEVLALASVARKSDSSDAFVVAARCRSARLRGPAGTEDHRGPDFRPGEREVLAGKSAQSQFSNLDR